MKKFSAVGAYVYAGGFTVGISKYFSTKWFFQDNNYGEATRKANFPGIRTIHLLDDMPEGNIDFVYSNPPCAIWSNASNGRKTHWSVDPRLNDIRNVFALLKKLRPRIWVWESVIKAYTHGNEFVKELESKARKLGYSCTHVLIDAQYLNLPQVRKRYFCIFHNVKLKLKLPEYENICISDVLNKCKNVDDLPAPKRWKSFLRKAKAGSLHSEFNRIYNVSFKKGARIRNRPGFLVKRLYKKQVTYAVVGNTLIHPVYNRFLNIEEYGALCTYPKNYKWIGSKSSIPSQMARAVMPKVGEWLAKYMHKALVANIFIDVPKTKLIDLRKP